MRAFVRNVPFQNYLRSTSRFASEPPSAESFFFRAFNECIGIANAVVSTDYLQRMKSGILNPQDFGVLTVLDSYYCYRAAETMSGLLCQIDAQQELELHELVSSLLQGYREYNSTFFDDWHIRTSDSVNPTETFRSYAEHEHHIMCSEAPIYTLVAMLPCYYLWPWFADSILSAPDYVRGVYDYWLNCCLGYGSAYRIGNFIDEWQKQGKEFDEELAMQIYKTSMNFELAAFSEAAHTYILAGKEK